MSALLELRSVHALLDKDFFVPAYQRGYRWTPRQVEDLVSDLYDFMLASRGNPAAFYCLQPIVVTKRKDGRWELIDGQQRLTTIFLIMSALETFVQAFDCSPYTIAYETRPHSAAFLAKPQANAANDNIDFFHMWQARETIVKWFEAHPKAKQNRFKFVDFLLAAEGNNPRVIWYELPAGADPIDVFVRLNVGRIPLTNAELIRAVFLRERNFEQPLRRLQIAHEWDQLEKMLRRDAFWHFVNGAAPDAPTRIELLFAIDLLRDGVSLAEDDPYGIFIAFQEASGLDWLLRWRKIKQIALRLEEWFDDRVFFHLIGAWLHLKTTGSTTDKPADVLVELLARRRALSRSAFPRELLDQIGKRLLGKPLDAQDPSTQVQDFLNGLEYGSDSSRARIRDTLLLFNIATIVCNKTSSVRFPFERFHSESWDIEHIRSVTEYRPERADHQKQWLDDVWSYWQVEPPEVAHAGVVADVGAMRADFQAKGFDALYWRVLAVFGEHNPSDSDNSIGNLTLLDAGTNRGYGNAPFPVKRQKVLAKNKTGTFVPLCTTNAFLKYYSPHDAGLMYWIDKDASGHAAAIHEMLVKLLGGEL